MIDKILVGKPVPLQHMRKGARPVPWKIASDAIPSAAIHRQDAVKLKFGGAGKISDNPNMTAPIYHTLTNKSGRYVVKLGDSGAGDSRFLGQSVTRWRPDKTTESSGIFIYLRDKEDPRQLWSATGLPMGKPAHDYEAQFTPGSARFTRQDNGIQSTTEVFVSPDDDAEIRLLTLKNDGTRDREIEVTSYLEPVLINPVDDAFHPAFQSLFLQTAYQPDAQSILINRRPRDSKNQTISAAHVIATDGHAVGPVEYETDRNRFLGRGGAIHKPAALQPDQLLLSNTVGPVLDPVASLRTTVRIPAGGTVQVAFTTLGGEKKDTIITRAGEYKNLATIQRMRNAVVKENPAFNPAPLELPTLEAANGYGGFADNGREYVIIQKGKTTTPAPWINVIANNDRFGFQVSESGAGYTWAAVSSDSPRLRLTPWSNDPVCDPAGEAFYLKDEHTGALWSPTARPIRDPQATYVTRHGQGYSRFETNSQGIHTELLQLASPDEPIKISRLKLTNTSQQPRQLSLTNYMEWVLGARREETADAIVTERDPETGALFAYNPKNEALENHVVFMDLGGQQTGWTGDRTEFLGRNGHLDHPAGLEKGQLSGKTGAGLDPCGVLQSRLALAPGEQKEIVALLGQAPSKEAARAMIRKYRRKEAPEKVLAAVKNTWETALGKVQVKTPDRSLDLMLNRWALYQAMASRFLGRSAFYQVSDGFGFRDQLQDSMALLLSRPDLAKAHILRAAARQFKEGDVQHWWLPPDLGPRTQCSDDLVWLPYVVAQYVKVTGDAAILKEPVPFLEGEPLQPGQDEHMFRAKTSTETGTLFEHCVRALNKSLTRVGEHNLPLMGTCDWNDGMNRVGHQGKGESTWMAWFLYDALNKFIPVAQQQNRADLVEQWTVHQQKLKDSAENAWDGEWYKRAFDDEGIPWGSKENDECKIDSLSQAWAAISGAAPPARARQAMASVETHLIDWKNKLSRLLYPAFDKTSRDPGYIKGYLPGVRENGQYTHAALWNVLALTRLGEGDKAWKLLHTLNPVNHALTRKDADVYKVEPYAVAADVYSEPPHVGRGGWTWYTGSAAWMYRVGLENILGLQVEGNSLRVEPCIPKEWPGFEMDYKHGRSVYHIQVENPAHVSTGVQEIKLDGTVLKDAVPLVDDGQRHHVTIRLGKGPA